MALAAPERPKTLEIGAPAPDFSLPGVDGKTHTLSEYADSKLLVIIFTCNHCPDALAAEGRIKSLTTDYKEKGVTVVAISGNDPLALQLWELGWSVYGDSFEEMKLHAKDQKFNFPYLYDGDTQKTTLAYGAQATPHVFVFDEKRTLRYQGRLDNGRRNFGPASENNTRDALADALDPEWQGPLPHTVLIAPGGNVLYRHTGIIDPIELRRLIVAQLRTGE